MYTHEELTVKRHTVYAAIQVARLRLGNNVKMCVNAVSGRSPDEALTTKELNELADQLVSDSQFYR